MEKNTGISDRIFAGLFLVVVAAILFTVVAIRGCVENVESKPEREKKKDVEVRRKFDFNIKFGKGKKTPFEVPPLKDKDGNPVKGP